MTVINRSSVSLRIMVFRPTFSTGSLPQSTSFRMVFLPIPVHSAASSMVNPTRSMVINGLAEALLTTPEWLTGLSEEKEYSVTKKQAG